MHGAQRGPASGGEADQLGPGVSRVGDPLHVAVSLQRRDDLGDRLPGDAEVGGEAGGVPAAAEQGDLACHTAIFAAIGPDSATELGGCQDPAPVSVIAIHGTADQNIPYDGGEGDGVAHIDGPAIPAVNASWRQADSCPAPTVTTVEAVTTSVAACPAGRTVELITIAGAGHQWPDAVSNPVAQRLLGTDPPSTALNATVVIWHFFAAHAR